MEAAIYGNGIALADQLTASIPIAEGRLIRPIEAEVSISRSIYLANRGDLKSSPLVARFARRVAVTFPSSAAHFRGVTTVWTGNPLRPELRDGSRVPGLVVVGFAETYRKGAHTTGRALLHERYDQRGVDAPGQESPERNIRHHS